jgi:membrane fusion protein, multidrug efflux system
MSEVRNRYRVASTMLLIAPLLALTVACSGKSDAAAKGKEGGGGPGGKGKGAMEFPVEVLPVRAQNVEYAITGVGSIEAFETVAVTARVAGAIERVSFIEGQRVKAGTTLVEVEPQRYKLAVDAARANYEKALASLSEAQAGLARRESANAQNPGLIPAEQVQTFRTRVETARSEVAQARAALNQAELNLRDAYVKAPVSGIIQTRTVQTGQYVPVGTVMATLVRRDPLLLRFRIPEQEARAIRTGMPAKFTVTQAAEAYDARITHVSGSADPETRMLELTAEINDKRKETLTPGSFARVSVPIGTPSSSPVIPQTSIRPTEKGFVTFVVDNNVAHERIVNLGMRTAEGMVEVKSGVVPGELLVIRGAEALREGAKVKVVKTSS